MKASTARGMTVGRFIRALGCCLALALLVGCRTAPQKVDGPSVPRTDRPPPPAATPQPAPPTPPGPSVANPLRPRIKMDTSLGGILVELDAENAPATVLNFVHFAQNKFYDGTIFHRVLADQMVQGGGYTRDMDEKPLTLKPAFDDTWVNDLKCKRGTVALVRPENPSAKGTAQFFINTVDNAELDSGRMRGAYAVFGTVVGGTEVVERIREAPLGTHPKYAAGRSAVVPVEPIVVKSIRLVTEFDPSPILERASRMRDAQLNRIDAIVADLEQSAGSKAVVSESGLRYVDFSPGFGHSPEADDYVLFNYRGTLVTGVEFENSYGNKPALRQLKTLVPGLQEALSTMRAGGRRTAIVPPKLGYGETGIPGRIPSDSTLIFELELLEIKGE